MLVASTLRIPKSGVDTSSRIALTPPSRRVNRTAPLSVVVVSARSHGRVPTTARPLARSQGTETPQRCELLFGNHPVLVGADADEQVAVLATMSTNERTEFGRQRSPPAARYGWPRRSDRRRGWTPHLRWMQSNWAYSGVRMS